MKNLRLYFALLLVLLCFVVKAQDSIKTRLIDEVKVISSRKPSVLRSASPLQVVNTEGIERTGILSVSDAVRRLAGVAVKDFGGIGGLKTVSVRGLGAQHTAVLYDGASMNDAQSAQVDIGRFSLENISFISLSIGQPNDIFQPAKAFASASVLDIKTNAPSFLSGNYKGKLTLKTGSFGLFNPSLQHAQKVSKNWIVSATGDWQRADGNYPFKFNNGASVENRKRINSDVDIWRTEFNVYADLKKAGSLKLKAYYYDAERGLPGSVKSDNIYAGERLWNKDLMSYLNYENTLSTKFWVKGLTKFARFYNKYYDKNINQPGGSMTSKYTQFEYYASSTVLYKPTSVLSFSLAQDYSYNLLNTNFVDQKHPSRNTSQTALNGQYSTNRMVATVGLLGTYVGEAVEVGQKPADKKRLSPALSLSYKPCDFGLRARLSYKDILRVPTFSDLYYSRIGNTKLRPEKAQQYNVGFTYGESINSWLRFFSLSVDGYVNKVTDKIVIASPSMFVFKMMNMDNVTIKGGDVCASAEISLSPKLSIFANVAYSYQEAENDRTNQQIPYTPKHTANGGLSVENPWINLSYSFVASGKQYSLPENIEMNKIKPYFDQTISVNKTLAWIKYKLRFQGELINLGNKNYEVIKLYPMPGRSFRLSVQLTY